MDVKIKKLSENAVIPKYAKEFDAALDIVCTSIEYDQENNVISYGTGLAIQLPPGYCALLLPRSSVYKKDLTLSNSCGLLDVGYQDEIFFKFRFRPGTDKIYSIGDRIGQILIIQNPRIEFVEVDELGGYNRGGGYGSTGV
jgi:dUTP pyrophosphatase